MAHNDRPTDRPTNQPTDRSSQPPINLESRQRKSSYKNGQGLVQFLVQFHAIKDAILQQASPFSPLVTMLLPLWWWQKQVDNITKRWTFYPPPPPPPPAALSRLLLLHCHSIASQSQSLFLLLLFTRPPARPYQVTEKLKKAVGYWLLLDFVCLLYSTLLRLSLVSVRPLLSNHVAITNKKRGGGSGDGKSSFHPICSGPPASKESFSFSSLAMSVATTTTTAIITNSPYLFVGSFLLRWPSSSYSIENSNCAKPRVKGIV